MSTYDPGREPRKNIRQQIFVNGQIRREYQLRSGASYDFYAAAFTLENLPLVDLQAIRTLERDGEPFVFVPEPGLSKGDVYLCFFRGPFTQPRSNPVPELGFSLDLKVEEVGSA